MEAGTILTGTPPSVGLTTLIGLATVFTALLTLVGLLKVLGLLLGPEAEAARAAAVPAEGAPTSEKAEVDTDRLRSVAIAAFALHQSHRVSVRHPEATTPWGAAAKVAALRTPRT